MTQLVRSHRTFGFKIGTMTTEDGTELTILKTAPHKLDVAPSHALLPVSDSERAFEARMALAAAIERCAFLGVDLETLPDMVRQEIRLFREEQR